MQNLRDSDKLWKQTGVEEAQLTQSIYKLQLSDDPELTEMIENNMKEMSTWAQETK